MKWGNGDVILMLTLDFVVFTGDKKVNLQKHSLPNSLKIKKNISNSFSYVIRL